MGYYSGSGHHFYRLKIGTHRRLGGKDRIASLLVICLIVFTPLANEFNALYRNLVDGITRLSTLLADIVSHLPDSLQKQMVDYQLNNVAQI